MSPDPRQVDGLGRRHLFGLDMIDAETLESVLDVVLSEPPSRHPAVRPVLLTPNVDIMVQLERCGDPAVTDLFHRAQYVLPDGMPIVMASGLLGPRLSARLPGSGLFELMWPRLAAEKRSVLVLCSSDEIADHLAEEHPDARFVVPPMFDATAPDELDAVVDDLLAGGRGEPLEFFLSGLGHPKDSIVITRFLERVAGSRLHEPLCMGLGGSFAMYAGLQKRAPDWVQRAGLEWFFRFTQEPRRLFHRYFIRDVAFLGIVARARRARGAGPMTS